MTREVTIFWPDAPLASELGKAMGASGFSRKPKVVIAYPSLHEVSTAVGSSSPSHVVVVGLTEQRHALELIREISAHHPEVVIAAADRTRESDAVIAAMRAGATEFLAPPFDFQHLLNSVSKRPRAAAAEPRAGRMTAVLPARGGCGASMVAIHLAHAIHLVTKGRVLLVDFDFQAGSLAFRLGVTPDFTLADALRRIDMINELWERLSRQDAGSGDGFEVLTAPPSFKSMPLESLGKLPDLFQSAMRTYSHVVVDMPPGIYSASEHVLAHADQVHLVTTPEVVALHLARRRVTELLEMGVSQDRIHLVVNRMDSKQTLREKEIQQAVGIPISRGLRNDYGAVSNAALKGQLIEDDSDLGKQLLSLARQILGADEKPTESSGWKKLLRF